MITEYLHLPYNEDRLSIEEVNELENFAFELFCQLETKVHEMNLTMTDFTITKFTQEELAKMPVLTSKGRIIK